MLSGEVPLEFSTSSSRFGMSRVCTAYRTPEVLVLMFKAEQKAVIPKGVQVKLAFWLKNSCSTLCLR